MIYPWPSFPSLLLHFLNNPYLSGSVLFMTKVMAGHSNKVVAPPNSLFCPYETAELLCVYDIDNCFSREM